MVWSDEMGVGACGRGGKRPGGSAQYGNRRALSVGVSGRPPRTISGPTTQAQELFFFFLFLLRPPDDRQAMCVSTKPHPDISFACDGAGFRAIIVSQILRSARFSSASGARRSHTSYAVRYRGLCRIAGCRRSDGSLPELPAAGPVTGTLTCQGSMRETFVAGGGASSSFSTTDPVQGSIGAAPSDSGCLGLLVGWLVGRGRKGEGACGVLRVSRCVPSAELRTVCASHISSGWAFRKPRHHGEQGHGMPAEQPRSLGGRLGPRAPGPGDASWPGAQEKTTPSPSRTRQKTTGWADGRWASSGSVATPSPVDRRHDGRRRASPPDPPREARKRGCCSGPAPRLGTVR